MVALECGDDRTKGGGGWQIRADLEATSPASPSVTTLGQGASSFLNRVAPPPSVPRPCTSPCVSPHIGLYRCRCLRDGSVVTTVVVAPAAEGFIGVVASKGFASATAPSPAGGPVFRRCHCYKGIVGRRKMQ
uniref:Uncharacterized protein n=1 Tax=Oryza punctata TaxID=4537 RepID=A0A0E0MBA9_ORYPU